MQILVHIHVAEYHIDLDSSAIHNILQAMAAEFQHNLFYTLKQ